MSASLNAVDRIVVPGLHHRFGHVDEEHLKDFYLSLTHRHINYASFHQDWLLRLLEGLYGKNHAQGIIEDEDVYFTSESRDRLNDIPEAIEEEEEGNIEEPREARPVSEEQASSRSLSLQDKREQVIVYGISYQYHQERFHSSDFYETYHSP